VRENALVDPNTRQGKRTPVTLKIKFKSETLEQFIERYAVDVSQGGIFIRTKEPLAVGTQMKFEFQLRDASPLIAGEGTVVWTRENDPSRPAIAPGMGVRFDRLGEGSQNVLEKILAEKAKQAPQRGSTEGPTKPPLFTDTPTRVAPAPVQDQLLGTRSGRNRADSEQTPLPKPMPFHSDADEFGAEAFEEATKVRALDELVAQTADANAAHDELAARRGRAETPLAEPPAPDDRMKTVPDRDSAPGLPSPPEANQSGRTGKLLDTSPSPRTATPSSGPPLRPSQPGLAAPGIPPGNDLSGRTRLGLEPAKAQTIPPRNQQYNESTERVAAPRAVAAEQSHPSAPKRPSSAPIVIGILVVVAAAMAAVWYFVLRDQAAETVATKHTGSGSAVGDRSTGSGSANAMTGSGSAVAMTGSGSATVEAPKGPLVDTEIASNVAKATVTVVDTDQTGSAPFKAKLEKDKVYKVRIEAAGYLKTELDVKGGQDKVTAKLLPKPHVLSVSSDPPGAQVWIDNAPTGKTTPADIELTAAQAAKPKVNVMLRKAGFRPFAQMVDAAAYTDEEARSTGKVDAKLAVMIVINNNNNTHPNNAGSNAGSAAAGSNAGSASTGSGSGGTTPPETGSGGGTTPPTGTGSASTTPVTGTKSGSGGDGPEPDWSKQH
jgi:uncharacterized protein (TIGR02266 family)